MRQLRLRVVLSWMLFGAVLPAQDLAPVKLLLQQATDAMGKGEQKAAILPLTQALDLLDRLDPGCRLRDAAGHRWSLSGLAQQVEPDLARRGWRGVVDYYEHVDAAVLADPQQAASFQKARVELAKALAELAWTLRDANQAEAARKRLTESLDGLDQWDRDGKDRAAMDVRYRCGQVASGLDSELGLRAWDGVLAYFTKGGTSLPTHEDLGFCQRARAAKADVLEQRQVDGGRAAEQKKSNFADALALRMVIVADWEKSGNKAELATALADLARTQRDANQAEDARKRLTESLDGLDQWDRDGKDSAAMAARYRCGQAAWEFDAALGKRAWTAVIKFYEQSPATALADPQQMGSYQDARASLAAIHEQQRDRAGFDEGERLRRRILDTWEKAGAKAQAALARASLGQSLVQRGMASSEKGKLELKRAYDDIRRERPDSDEVAQIARIYANSLVDMGQDLGPLTIELQRAALRIWEKQPPADPRELIDLKWETANTMFKAGDLVDARKLAQESCEAAQLHKSVPLQAYWPSSFYAMVLRSMGDSAAAKRLTQQNLDLCLAHCPPKDSTLMHAWLNVGYIHWVEGDLKKAIEAFEHGRKAIVSTDTTVLTLGNVALLHDNLGQCYADQGDSKKAIELLAKALSICKGPVAKAQIRGGMAMAMQRDGQLKKAADEFDKDKSVQLVASTQGYPNAVLYLGRQALTLAELPGDKRLPKCLEDLLAVTKKGVQECYTLPGRPSHQLATVVDGAAQLVFALADRAGPARDALERQAFEALESLRSVDLRVTSLAQKLESKPEVEELRVKAQAARAELARLASLGEGTEEDVLKAAATRDEEEFKLLYAALKSAAPDNVVEVTVAGIAAALPPDAAAVAFRMLSLRRPKNGKETTEEEFEAHIVTKTKDGRGKLERVRLGPPKPIRDAARLWLEQIVAGNDRGSGRTPDEAKGPDPAVTLSDLVFARMKAALGTAKILIVCLDDDLHRVPVELLPGFKNLELRYAVSLADLLVKPSGELLPPSLFAIGGVDFANPPGDARAADGGDGPAASDRKPGDRSRGLSLAWGSEAQVSGISFADLPGTAKEVEAIAKTFNDKWKQSAVPLTGRSATREAFTTSAQKARFLLFATHGYFLRATEDNHSDRDTTVRGFAPMSLCGLALTGANLTGREEHKGYLGVITAEEIAALDLSGCELAALSACGSYLGQARAGHGLASLQGALHAAGARVVVATRWDVDDDAATELMTAFYRWLWEEKKQPREALAAAKKQMATKEQYSKSKFWAGFVLTGDLLDRKPK